MFNMICQYLSNCTRANVSCGFNKYKNIKSWALRLGFEILRKELVVTLRLRVLPSDLNSRDVWHLVTMWHVTYDSGVTCVADMAPTLTRVSWHVMMLVCSTSPRVEPVIPGWNPLTVPVPTSPMVWWWQVNCHSYYNTNYHDEGDPSQWGTACATVHCDY